LDEATIPVPPNEIKNPDGYGKEGYHSENLNEILLEMQSLQRTYPGCEW
jgi:ring-1,2-phenylacetyl-CoA epoxidase subunit PaaC